MIQDKPKSIEEIEKLMDGEYGKPEILPNGKIVFNQEEEINPEIEKRFNNAIKRLNVKAAQFTSEQKQHEEIWKLIENEIKRARKKFSTFPCEYVDRAAILAEEAGEVIKAALKHKYERGAEEDIKIKAIQTAAMVFRLIEGY